MQKVKASMMNAIHDLPLLVARDEGFFRDEGLDVEIIKTPGSGQRDSDHQALRANIFERNMALKRGEVAAVSLMEPWISVAEKQGMRVLMESHSTRSEAAGEELDGPTLRKMFAAEAEAARAIDRNPGKYAHYLVDEAGGMLELNDLKLARILNAPPEPYTRERFDHTYQWTRDWGLVPAGEVAEAIPQLKKVARLDVEEVIRVGSSSITVENWLALARRINEILAKEPEVKAVVVTHGSNTVEETGYFLSLTVKSDKPVVLTAAQRQFTTLSSDSPKNFLQAVRVAATDEARGKGALVVNNDLINSGRDVTKNIAYRVDTYSSRDVG